jgi:hypothetical protein
MYAAGVLPRCEADRSPQRRFLRCDSQRGLRAVRYQDDLDAPVLRTSGIGIVADNRAGVAITLDRELRDRDARCVDQPVAHGPGARDRQLQIAAGVADVIRVSGDQNPPVRMNPD